MARVAGSDEHTGGMIALVPRDDAAAALSVEGSHPAAEARDELHLTLAYLGDDVTDWSADQRETVRAAVASVAARFAPVEAEVMAHSVFNPNGDGGRDPATVYLVTGADLARLHEQVAEHSRSEFPVYLPHVTAGYGVPVEALTYTGPVIFDRIRLALAGGREDFPLTGPPTDEPNDPDPDEQETKGRRKVARGIVWEAKAKVASEAGEKRYGLPIGTELGQARNTEGQAAQADAGAQDSYRKLLTANPRDYRKMLDEMSDVDLEKLSKIAYSFRSSNTQVVQARLALAAALRRRGKDVNDFGGLGKSSSAKGKSSRSGKSKTAKTNRAAKKGSDATWVGDEDWATRRTRRTKLGLMGKGNPPSAKTKKGEGDKPMTLHVYEDGSWQYKSVGPAPGFGVVAVGDHLIEGKAAMGKRPAGARNDDDGFDAELDGSAGDDGWDDPELDDPELDEQEEDPDAPDDDDDADDEGKSAAWWLAPETKARTTTKPWETRKAQRGGKTIGKDKSSDKDGGDEYPVRTVGDIAAGVKRAKQIKDPKRKAEVLAHLRAGAKKIGGPAVNIVPKDGADSGGKGGKGDKGTGKSAPPWAKGKSAFVDIETMDPDQLARHIQCKVMSPDPRAAKLRDYWAFGKGRAKWRPGTGGDFERLRKHLRKYVPAHMLNGLTANIHKLATGEWPGKNAHGGKRGKSAAAELGERVEIKATDLLEAEAVGAGADSGDADAVDLALDRYADMADEITTEEEYEEALASEIDWDLLPDGYLDRVDGGNRNVMEPTDDPSSPDWDPDLSDVDAPVDPDQTLADLVDMYGE